MIQIEPVKERPAIAQLVLVAALVLVPPRAELAARHTPVAVCVDDRHGVQQFPGSQGHPKLLAQSTHLLRVEIARPVMHTHIVFAIVGVKSVCCERVCMWVGMKCLYPSRSNSSKYVAALCPLRNKARLSLSSCSEVFMFDRAKSSTSRAVVTQRGLIGWMVRINDLPIITCQSIGRRACQCCAVTRVWHRRVR